MSAPRQPTLDQRLQARADAAEEQRVRAEIPEPRYCKGCGGQLDPSGVPLLVGDWHPACAEAEFATGDPGYDMYDPADALCREIVSPLPAPRDFPDDQPLFPTTTERINP